jgi:hypothetical protein
MRIGVLRSFLPAVLAAASIVFGAGPALAAPPVDLSELPLAYLADGPRLIAGYQGADAPGDWSVTGGGLDADDRLTLDIEIRLDPLSVPLDPGPAVLFGGVTLAGDAGGDVGVNVPARRIVTQILPPCDPADCVHRTSITLPTDRLARLARGVDARGWMSIEVSLSLVRTFAQGTWIQYVALSDEDREAGENGTAGAPAPFTSPLAGGGATPVERTRSGSRRSKEAMELVERLVASTPDPSRRPTTVPLLVDITTSSCTPGYTIVTSTGDAVVDQRRLGSSQAVRVDVPVGTTWMVAVPSRWWGRSERNGTFAPIDVEAPTAIRGHVSGDGEDGMCPIGGSVSWRMVNPDEVTEFPWVVRCAAPGRGAIVGPTPATRCLS